MNERTPVWVNGARAWAWRDWKGDGQCYCNGNGSNERNIILHSASPPLGSLGRLVPRSLTLPLTSLRLLAGVGALSLLLEPRACPQRVLLILAVHKTLRSMHLCAWLCVCVSGLLLLGTDKGKFTYAEMPRWPSRTATKWVSATTFGFLCVADAV